MAQTKDKIKLQKVGFASSSQEYQRKAAEELAPTNQLICPVCDQKLKSNGSHVNANNIRRRNYRCPKCGQAWYKLDNEHSLKMYSITLISPELNLIVKKIISKVSDLVRDPSYINKLRSNTSIDAGFFKNFDVYDEQQRHELLSYDDEIECRLLDQELLAWSERRRDADKSNKELSVRDFADLIFALYLNLNDLTEAFRSIETGKVVYKKKDLRSIHHFKCDKL